jgi:tetratricopeptide (TPR) repeat protein
MRYFLLAFLCASALAGSAQIQPDRIKEGTNTIALFIRLGSGYMYSSTDSCYYYGSRAFELSKTLDDRNGQIVGLILMGSALAYSGSYPEGLRLGLRALELAESSKDSTSITDALNLLGTVYYFQKDFKLALNYFSKSLTCAVRINSTAKQERELGNVGDAWLALNGLDSALYYTTKAYKTAIAAHLTAGIGDELTNLAEIYNSSNHFTLAHRYYQQGMDANLATGYFDNYCEGSLGAARLFLKEGRNDSAQSYALLSFQTATFHKITTRQLEASRFIEALFESDHRSDSAFKYLKITNVLQDSLYGMDKAKQVQTMTLEENIRQQDIVQEKKQAKETAVKNLQLIAIGIFIVMFSLIVVFLARIKVRSRLIEFLAVLNLLLFFEFITDLAFPYISNWTNDSPAWEMLILVLIAGLLEPLNHRVEGWIKEKVART